MPVFWWFISTEFVDDQSGEVVYEGGGDHYEHIYWFTPCVEEQTGDKYEEVPQLFWHYVVEHQNKREK